VVVTTRQQLIAQTVATALRERGIPAEPLSWQLANRRSGPGLSTGDILVLFDDPASARELDASCDLISRTPARCLVMTRRPPGPVWGALLAHGAAAVVAAEGTLEQLDAIVNRVADGVPVMDESRRAALVRAWEEWCSEDERLCVRVAQLSPRERQILAMLADGSRVADIIDALGVAEATVRSQVKSMRRKLGVDSQLGAVATLHRLERSGYGGGRRRSPDRPDRIRGTEGISR
jgi:DNA-binding NarL/FixJ family response regulator